MLLQSHFQPSTRAGSRHWEAVPCRRTSRAGSAENPANRFESTRFERDPESIDPDDPEPSPATVFLPDASRTIIATNQSPDVGFDASINPYRGCEHGCIYCYARPTHEYLGFSAGLDFETKILVKHDAPALLRRELMKPGWVPRPIAISGVTDAYQPVERRLRLHARVPRSARRVPQPGRRHHEEQARGPRRRPPGRPGRLGAASVYVSVTTLDPELARSLEPRASTPSGRLEAVAALSAAGVPVGVAIAPVIPGLNDHEIPAILKAASEAGARYAFYNIVRLPLGVADLFADWLDRHAPLGEGQGPQSTRGDAAAAGSTTPASATGWSARGPTPT